jgi:hypothetical protein
MHFKLALTLTRKVRVPPRLVHPLVIIFCNILIGAFSTIAIKVINADSLKPTT